MVAKKQLVNIWQERILFFCMCWFCVSIFFGIGYPSAITGGATDWRKHVCISQCRAICNGIEEYNLAGKPAIVSFKDADVRENGSLVRLGIISQPCEVPTSFFGTYPTCVFEAIPEDASGTPRFLFNDYEVATGSLTPLEDKCFSRVGFIGSQGSFLLNCLAHGPFRAAANSPRLQVRRQPWYATLLFTFLSAPVLAIRWVVINYKILLLWLVLLLSAVAAIRFFKLKNPSAR